MIKYTILPGQPEESVDIAKEIFHELESRGITNIPIPKRSDHSLLYLFDDGEIDLIGVFFKPLRNNIGLFYMRIPDSTGSYHIESAKFKYENVK
jgi:hypothetical protein